MLGLWLLPAGIGAALDRGATDPAGPGAGAEARPLPFRLWRPTRSSSRPTRSVRTHDWRLRECDYGERNGMPVDELHGTRRLHLNQPYPGGESWQQAVARVGRFLDDLPLRWEKRRVLVIGHTATRWAFDHLLTGKRRADLVDAPFQWQEGWEYTANR